MQTKQSVGAQDTTQKVKQLVQAKTTGKALGNSGTSGIVSDNEVQANQAAQVQLEQQNQQSQIQSQQLSSDIALQQDTQTEELSAIDQQSNQISQQLAQQEEILMGDITRQLSSMNQEKKELAMEQLGFTMALQDTKYLDALKQEGQKRRLDNELDFREELVASQFKDMENLARDKTELYDMVMMDERQFQERLGRMDIDYAMEIASQAIKDNNTSAIVSGISGIASGIVTSAYGTKKEDS